MDFDQYKHRLKEYLGLKGVDISKSPTHCFNSNAHRHGDATPSCQLWDDAFKCHGCGIQGDIYDAVEILEGITGKKDQYLFVERLFNGSPAPPIPAGAEQGKAAEDFQPDAGAMRTFEEWLRKNASVKDKIREFLCERAAASVPGASAYPPDVEAFMLANLYYWPGLAEARKYLGDAVLRKCGIPLINPTTGHSTWASTGVVMKLGVGYKLHYYQSSGCNACKKISACPKAKKDGFCKTCEKRTSKGGKTFPMPGALDPASPVVLVEGEMNALSCAGAGLQNVFAIGGTNGLTMPKVKQHLLGAPEIILFFDADTAGRKASGLEPLDGTDKRKTNIPQIIRRAGYEGTIKTAELPLPSVTGYKDQDGLILAGKREVIYEALAGAREWAPPKPVREKIFPRFEKFLPLSMKRLRCLLRKLGRERLDIVSVGIFFSACLRAFPYDETRNLLREWGADENEFFVDENASPYSILGIIAPHVSRYILRVIEQEITPVEELLKSVTIQDIKFALDLEEIEISQCARYFVHSGDTRAAALTLAEIFDGNIIYNDAKNDKRFYFFNGHIWQHEPDKEGVIYNTLLAVMRQLVKQEDMDDDEAPSNKKMNKLAKKLGEYRTRRDIAREFSKLNGVYHNSDDVSDTLRFDSDKIRETLTLRDCVLDFSGNEIVFRKSLPDEFRKETLPYTREQVQNAPTDHFWDFMRGNFKNPETLDTFMYYLSLIASRTQYKYGAFFIGGKDTGKSVTISMIESVYTRRLIGTMEPDVLVPKGKTFATGNGPSPYLAKLEGLCASITSETEDGARLNAATWKRLTGGDTITARGLNEAPKEFVNTAQIIISTNALPRFDRHDEAVLERIIVIPFLVKHFRDAADTKDKYCIMESLTPEFPGIVRVFAEYYIRLKIKLDRKIPISPECAAHKNEAIAEVETDVDKYIKSNIIFEKSGRVKVKDIYKSYCDYYDFDENSVKRGEALSRIRFTKFILKSYKEEVREDVRRIDGEGVRLFFGMRFKTQQEFRADENAVAENVRPDEESPF